MALTASLENIQNWLDGGGKTSIEAMRPIVGMHQNALLRRYEWEEIDRAVVDIARLPNVAMADFQRLGLIRPLGGLGVIVSTYEQLGDMSDAELSMEGIKRGEMGQVDYTPQSVPVPIIHKDFQVYQRYLAVTRRNGEPIDVTNAQVATRRVRDRIEQVIFNGDTKSLKGYTIYGFRTKPERLQKTAAQCGGGDFATEGNPYKTLVGGVGFLTAAGFPGPFGVYVARSQYTEMLHRLTDGSSKSELAAINEGIPGLSFISPADALTAGEVIMWQLATDVADVAVAQDIATVQWDEMGGMIVNFRVMTALVPRFKHDANGACGLLHITGC